MTKKRRGERQKNNVIKGNLQNDNNFACSECGKKFEFQSNLVNHKLIAHKKAIFDFLARKVLLVYSNIQNDYEATDLRDSLPRD